MDKPSISPKRWTPPPAPELAGRWHRNDDLDGLRLIPVPGEGPEDVAVLPDGRLVTGLVDGRIVAIDATSGAHEVLASLGGRPLGVEVHPDGSVIVCDADRGLTRVTLSGRIETLASEVEGRPLVLTNNATVADDGTIYFTESSTRFPLAHYRADLLEHSATGALFALDPESGKIERLLSGLTFANGVTMHPDGQSVLVAETGGYGIHRVHVSGARSGQVDQFINNLPGHPDNLSTGPDGTIWVAMAALRNPALDRLLPTPPVLRKLAWSLPEKLQPQPSVVAFVIGLDPSGSVAWNLQSYDGRFSFVTGVREHDGTLYLGSLHGHSIAAHTLR